MANSHDRNIPIEESNKCAPNIVKLESEIGSTILEENMEQLELEDSNIGDVIVNLESQNISNHVLRATTSNRRYSLRPQKRLLNTEFAVSPIKKGRLSMKKFGCLETIFEDPQHKNGSIVLLGRALKRSIAFNNSLNKTKIRHRKLKIKRLSKSNKNKPIKITLEDVKRKLSSVEECDSDDDEWIDITDPTS